MTFLESLKRISLWKADEVPLQHLLRAFHTGFAEITPHFQGKADGSIAFEVFLVGITDRGRAFIEAVEQAVKE